MKKLKMTQKGVEELTQELEKKKEELRQLGKYKGNAAANEGDAWHDNFAFEQTEIKERSLLRQISDLQEQISNAEIIKPEEDTENTNKVHIGSVVTVILKYDGGEQEECTMRFVENFKNSKQDIENVSINSPIGECIFGKTVGFEGKYVVNGFSISVKVKSISISE